MNLVTGYTGEAHVTSEDDALLFTALAGKSNILFNSGENFAESHTDNSITIESGDLLIGGRHARIEDSETFTFSPPGSGHTRIDELFVCYRKGYDGIETAYLDYTEGPVDGNIPPLYPSTYNALDPSFTYFSLYRINLSGTGVTLVTPTQEIGGKETLVSVISLDGEATSATVGSVAYFFNSFILVVGKTASNSETYVPTGLHALSFPILNPGGGNFLSGMIQASTSSSSLETYQTRASFNGSPINSASVGINNATLAHPIVRYWAIFSR